MRPFPLAIAACTGIVMIGSAPTTARAAAKPAAARVVGIASHIAEASQRFGIPEAWIYAVIRTESAGRIGVVSSAGAMGLMQLMPATWARQRTRYRLGANPFEPRDNILAGTSYLRELYDSYGASGFLAAYNAGPGRYEDWRDRGRPLPAETRAYVAKIASALQSGSAPSVAGSAILVQSARKSGTKGQLFSAHANPVAEASADYTAAARPSPLVARSDPHNGLFASVSGSRSQ
jgi:hypothetical protein